MVKRFITRDQMRKSGSGWSLDIQNKGYVFFNSKLNNAITIQMLKELQGKTEEECYAEYPQYTYTDDMFIEEKKEPENILKKVLTKEEYQNYLKGLIIDNVYNNFFELAKKNLNELCSTVDKE